MRHRTIWVVVAVAYAALASRFAPLTWPSMVATLPPVAAVIWADRHRRSERPSPAAVLTAAQVAPWAATAALLVGLEIAALPQQSRADFPTLSVFISPFAGDVTGWYRFGGYLAWFALGAWMARR